MSLYEYHSELKAESKLTSSVGNKKLTVLIKSHSLEPRIGDSNFEGIHNVCSNCYGE